ncbi:MAG: heavy-metal-associated domain-containing protein [Prevotellaceae bacterium]|jgi:copper chaperone CopZ|nr:heavy-metal-associated domain-containing protein [Prevotellaceae bacterium]
MKIIKLTIVALCMVVGASTLSAQDNKKDNKEADVTFKTNIECHNCEQKIMKNIPFDKGVKDVKVTLDKKEVKITYRTDKTDKEKLKKSIEKLGYTAEEIDPTQTTAALSGASCCSSKTADAAKSCEGEAKACCAKK